MNLEFRLQRRAAYWGDDIDVWVLDRAGDRYASEVVFEPRVMGKMMPALFSLPPETAQSIMDQLWTCGIRPTEGAGSAGAMAATERHLTDMRTLAFHALKVVPK